MTSEPASVVVVDDAADVRLLARTVLELSGRFVVVGEAGNGVEAIAAAERFRPELMLLDVSMPVMDGLEALPGVLAASPGTQVVMYSGFDKRGLAGKARALGASAFVEKSLSIKQLPLDLTAVLASRRPDLAAAPADLAPDTDPLAALDSEVLERHLERFREVFEEAAIGMGMMTLTGRLVRANQALAALVGRPLPALVGLPYVELAVDYDEAQMERALGTLSAGADVAVLEHDVRIGDGTRRLLATVSPARDARERPLYLFLQVQDVTAQRRAEAELRLSEQRFRALVDAVADHAIFMLDPSGIVVSWNAGAQRAKGYLADEIVGRHFRAFYPAHLQAAGHPEHELAIAARDGSYEEEEWRVRKDGTQFWANVVITAVRDDAGELIGYAKVTRDVTERRTMLAERERDAAALAAANRQLEQANARLAEAATEQAQFVAVTIHELRNPLAVVTGAAEMLAEHGADLSPAQQGALVTSMRSSSGLLNRLLADLLTSSRLELRAMDVTLERVDVAGLLDYVAAAAAQTWPHLAVSVECEPGLSVDADPDRLGQAVDNLVINALRHGAAPVELIAARNGSDVEIRVRDSGPGVSAELLPRLFGRFAAGRRAGGTGLGLFIVRELARAHGGDAWYEPRSADGRPTSCFVLSIPQHAAPG